MSGREQPPTRTAPPIVVRVRYAERDPEPAVLDKIAELLLDVLDNGRAPGEGRRT